MPGRLGQGASPPSTCLLTLFPELSNDLGELLPHPNTDKGQEAPGGVILARFHLSFTSQTETGSKTGILRISNPSPNEARALSSLPVEARMTCLTHSLCVVSLKASCWELLIVSYESAK